MKTYWRSEGIAPLILWPLHQKEVSGQLHALAALPREKEYKRNNHVSLHSANTFTYLPTSMEQTEANSHSVKEFPTCL